MVFGSLLTLPMAEAEGFLLHRAVPTRAEAVAGRAVSPEADTVSPTANMFFAAFISRSCGMPHSEQVH